MKPLIRNVLAVIGGFIAASVVNRSIILCGSLIVAPPPGADMDNVEGIRAAMTQMTPIHFLVPFLAHALGTLAGGLAAAVTAASRKMTFALVIGIIFLGSGITMVSMVGGPAWYIACDLGLAYVPMAWLGGRIGTAVTGRDKA